MQEVSPCLYGCGPLHREHRDVDLWVFTLCPTFRHLGQRRRKRRKGRGQQVGPEMTTLVGSSPFSFRQSQFPMAVPGSRRGGIQARSMHTPPFKGLKASWMFCRFVSSVSRPTLAYL